MKTTNVKAAGYRIIARLDMRRVLVRTMDRRLEVLVDRKEFEPVRNSRKSSYNELGLAMFRLEQAGLV